MGLRRAADRADFLTGRQRSAATGALSNVTVSPGQRLSYRVNILLRCQIALGVEDVIHQHFSRHVPTAVPDGLLRSKPQNAELGEDICLLYTSDAADDLPRVVL